MKKFTLFCFALFAWQVLLEGTGRLYAQNECTDATPLAFQGYSTCGDMAFSNISFNGAMPSFTTPVPTCGNFSAATNDIWVKFVVPGGTNTLAFHAFNSSALPIFNASSQPCLAIYRGLDCDNLTLLSCAEAPPPPFGANSDLRWHNQSGLIPGETLWVRLWDYSNASYDLFFAASKILNLPEDNCNTPQALGPGGCNILSIGGDVAAPDACGWSSTDNSIFYSFSVDANDAQPYVIQALNTECYGHTGGLFPSDVEIQIAIYAWDGTCNSIGGNGPTYMGCINGVGNVNFSANLPPGNYIMAIDGLSGTGTSLCTYGFVLPEKPSADFSPLVACTGAAITFTDLSSNEPTSWGWSFPGGSPDVSSQQNPTVVYPAPGDYQVKLTATNSYGATTIIKTVTVITPPTADAGANQTLCSDITNLSGGLVPNATYQWLQTGGPTTATISGTNTATPTVSNLSPGVYTFKYTVTTGLACSASDEVQVTVSGLPAADAGDNQSLCLGLNAALAAAAAAGQWIQVSGPNDATFSDNQSPNPSVSGLVKGIYIFKWTVTQGGCQNSDEMQLTVSQTPTPVIGGDLSYCDGETTSALVLSPPGGTLTGTGVTNNVFSPASAGAGTFTLTYTYTDNCGTTSTTQNVTVTAGAVPVTNLDPVYCIDDPIVVLTADPDGGTWSGPGTSFSFFPFPPGWKFDPGTAGLGVHQINYSIFGGGECNQITIQVTVTNESTAQIAPLPALCANSAPVTLNAIPAGGTFSGVGVSGGTFSPSTSGAGSFTLTYAGNGACGAYSTTLAVTVQSAPQAEAGADASFCGAEYTLGAQGNGSWVVLFQPVGSGPVIFSDLNVSDATISNLFPGEYTLQWTTGASACETTDELILTVGAADFAIITDITNVGCYGGNNGTITITNVSGGASPYQYAINGGAYQDTPILTGLTAGMYQLSVRDAAGCVDAQQVAIAQPARPLRFFTVFRKSYVCADCTDGKITASGIGGVPPYAYSLDGTNYQASGVFNNLSPAIYTLYLRDANGCVVTRQVILD